jgi:hypothetical protein
MTQQGRAQAPGNAADKGDRPAFVQKVSAFVNFFRFDQHRLTVLLIHPQSSTEHRSRHLNFGSRRFLFYIVHKTDTARKNFRQIATL